MTKISIITVNLNNKDGLRKTIESVVNQTYNDIEYIVIDGGSTDGSVDVIKEYAAQINYWVSEPDKGIYNAMNKGIVKASGEYLLFLNSGDWFYNSSVLIESSIQLTDELIVFGNGYSESTKGKLIPYYPPETVNVELITGNVLFHCSTFINKLAFEKYGYYNEFNYILSDWEFWLKVITINKCSYKKIDKFISVALQGGISQQQASTAISKKESLEIRQRYFEPEIYNLILNYLKLRNEVNLLKSIPIIKHVFKLIGLKTKIRNIFNKIT